MGEVGGGGQWTHLPCYEGQGSKWPEPASSQPPGPLSGLAGCGLEGPSLWCECQVLFPELQLFPGHVRGCH